jgi:hypothetical protein
MATETRSVPAMNVEPGQTDAAQRSKGFVRRNWLASVLVASALLMSSLQVSFFRETPAQSFNVHLFNGTLSICYWHLSSHNFDLFSFATPSLGIGSLPGWFESSFFGEKTVEGVIIPVWVLLLCPLAWIAFREWRRKGTACQQ